MTNIKNTIFNEIKKSDTIIIKRHKMPDGDCIGSGLGLCEILKASFPEKRVLFDSPDDSNYLHFINKGDNVTKLDHENALVIVVDTSVKSRVCNWSDTYRKVIKIDHHLPEDDYGDINHVISSYPACTLVIMDFFLTFKDELKFTKLAGKALFLGTVTDTGGFRYSNTDANTFSLTSEILKYGNFDIREIYLELEKQKLNEVRFKGYVASHFKIKDRVAYFYASKKIMEKFNLAREEARAQVSVMSGIDKIEAWLFFSDDDEKILIRFRSKRIPINEVAKKFGGGGHELACGGSILKKKDIIKVVDELNKAIAKSEVILCENTCNK